MTVESSNSPTIPMSIEDNNNEAMTAMPAPTDGYVHPVVKPGPIPLSVPPPVLSRASSVKSNDARAMTVPTTTDVILQPFDMPGPVLLSISDPALSQTSSDPGAIMDPTATDAIVYPVEKPGPVFLSVPPPVRSRASQNKEAMNIPTATDAIVHPIEQPGPIFLPVPPEVLSRASKYATAPDAVADPVEKPGPVFLSVPPPVLSRASIKTNGARAMTTVPMQSDNYAADLNKGEAFETSMVGVAKPPIAPPPKPTAIPVIPPEVHAVLTVSDMPTTLVTSSLVFIEKQDVVLIGPMVSLPPTRIPDVIRDAPTTYTVQVHDSVLVSGTYPAMTNEPTANTKNVDTAMIGWVVAAIVASIMTGLGVWWLFRNVSARKRRAANVRRNQGTAMWGGSGSKD